MRDKSQAELEYAGYLLAAVPRLAEAALSPQIPPEPDVLATVSARRFGIEVTEIHGIPQFRMTEAEQQKVMDEVAKEWRRAALPTVVGFIHWRPASPGWRRPPDLAKAIVGAIAARVHEDSHVVVEKGYLDVALKQPNPIEHIEIYHVEESESEWGLMSRWSTTDASPALLQREIDRKNDKPAGYVAKYDEIMLLLVQQGGGPSSGFGFRADFDQVVYRTTYHRAFLLQLAPLRVIELKVTRIEQSE